MHHIQSFQSRILIPAIASGQYQYPIRGRRNWSLRAITASTGVLAADSTITLLVQSPDSKTILMRCVERTLRTDTSYSLAWGALLPTQSQEQSLGSTIITGNQDGAEQRNMPLPDVWFNEDADIIIVVTPNADLLQQLTAYIAFTDAFQFPPR